MIQQQDLEHYNITVTKTIISIQNPNQIDHMNGIIEHFTPSSDGKSKHIVIQEGNTFECQAEKCIMRREQDKLKGTICMHIRDVKMKLQRQYIQYFMTRVEIDSHSHFKSFEDYFTFFQAHYTVEKAHLMTLTMSIAYSQETFTSDDIYNAVNGLFLKSGRVLGGVVKSLQKDKYIENIGIGISTRKIRHAGFRSVWRITQAGNDFVEHGGIC